MWAESACDVAFVDSSTRQSGYLVRVVDGDTIHVAAKPDGDVRYKIRLLGINTPELHPDKQPLGETAKHRLKQLLKSTDGKMYWYDGIEKLDRHKRTLAHVYSSAGINVTEAMLEEGLGFHIPIAPNLNLQNCYQAAERVARKLNRGVWGKSYYDPQSARNPTNAGFTLVQGTIEEVSESRHDFWLAYQGKLVLRLNKRLIPKRSLRQLKERLEGHKVMARGWMHKRKLKAKQKSKGYKPWVMRLGSWDSLEMPEKSP